MCPNDRLKKKSFFIKNSLILIELVYSIYDFKGFDFEIKEGLLKLFMIISLYN